MPLISLGHGRLALGDFLAQVQGLQLAFLGDLRSVPRSARCPHFDGPALKLALAELGIKYLPMGDQLGGWPPDASVLDDEGHVLYPRLVAHPNFQAGVARLKQAEAQGLRVGLMCSESDPATCHRSKALGVALEAEGVAIQHLLPDGRLASQAEILAQAHGLAWGQGSLFNLPPPPLRSRRSWRDEGPPGEDEH